MITPQNNPIIMKIIIAVLIIFLGVATGSALWFWYSKPVITTAGFVKAPPIPKVAKVKKVKIAGPKEVVAIDKPTLLQKIELPQAFKEDSNQQALATAQVPAYKGKTSIVAVMDVKEGTTTMIAKQEPLSLFALLNEKAVGVRGGVGTRGGIESAVYGSWNFVRIGGGNVGVYLEGTVGGIGDNEMRSDGKAMIQIEYRF